VGELLQVTKRGLYCPDGDFYIDPWKSVDRAIITHAHSDHARSGMRAYLCAEQSKQVLRLRVGQKANIEGVPYGAPVDMNGIRVSLHPAGHILGSAQIRVERAGEVAVVSGDYKTEADETCAAFEPIRCHTFVTESTFGMPIYRWPKEGDVFQSINRWWRANQSAGKATVLLGYSLGKSQRVLSGLDRENGPIFLHPALQPYTDAYREQGISLPPTLDLAEASEHFDWSKAAILAPPNMNGSSWLSVVGPYATAYMSGWMAIRGTWRSRSVDKGFVLSDHVDWPSLIGAVAETGAERVYVTHGFSKTVVRYLREQGVDAHVLPTGWEGESEERAELASGRS